MFLPPCECIITSCFWRGIFLILSRRVVLFCHCLVGAKLLGRRRPCAGRGRRRRAGRPTTPAPPVRHQKGPLRRRSLLLLLLLLLLLPGDQRPRRPRNLLRNRRHRRLIRVSWRRRRGGRGGRVRDGAGREAERGRDLGRGGRATEGGAAGGGGERGVGELYPHGGGGALRGCGEAVLAGTGMVRYNYVSRFIFYTHIRSIPYVYTPACIITSGNFFPPLCPHPIYVPLMVVNVRTACFSYYFLNGSYNSGQRWYHVRAAFFQPHLLFHIPDMGYYCWCCVLCVVLAMIFTSRFFVKGATASGDWVCPRLLCIERRGGRGTGRGGS